MTRAPLSYFTQDGFDAFQEMSTVQDDVFCMLRMDETGAFPVRVYTCRRLIDLSNDDCRYSAPLPSNLGDVAMKCVI